MEMIAVPFGRFHYTLSRNLGLSVRMIREEDALIAIQSVRYALHK
jgi:hypothetical protein